METIASKFRLGRQHRKLVLNVEGKFYRSGTWQQLMREGFKLWNKDWEIVEPVGTFGVKIITSHRSLLK
jgi:hypothetical protein